MSVKKAPAVPLHHFEHKCCCSVVSDSVTSWTAAHQASLSFTISWSLFKLMSIESLMPSNHLILCDPLLLPSLFPSIRVFFNELAHHIRWPKYWSFSFSISYSSEYSGLKLFRCSANVWGLAKYTVVFLGHLGLSPVHFTPPVYSEWNQVHVFQVPLFDSLLHDFFFYVCFCCGKAQYKTYYFNHI